MGMLMHHTWLEQQKKTVPAKEEKPIEKPEETKPVESAPARKPAGRRKVSK